MGTCSTGANGIAGEWGHNALPWPTDDERPGPSCYCGKSGCIETFLSGPGMSADHERAHGRQAGARRSSPPPHRGDAAAVAAMERYERRMARALAGVINVLDPDVIVLGGGMSNIERLYARVPRLWGDYVFAATGTRVAGMSGAGSSAIRTRLVRAKHGDASGVRGAAWLWDGRLSSGTPNAGAPGAGAPRPAHARAPAESRKPRARTDPCRTPVAGASGGLTVRLNASPG